MSHLSLIRVEDVRVVEDETAEHCYERRRRRDAERRARQPTASRPEPRRDPRLRPSNPEQFCRHREQQGPLALLAPGPRPERCASFIPKMQ